ncbi:MarR family winged helix-turn-helix transcriptional regulator [Motilimonas cestriensis]|uniref:MarR family winged helix-turn-helix transcriptional regulator n=1 Tax=Motilimonas cestriensis TaxID=2742685 RepID=A0ABS8W4P9_9GAMM|nr:helix-turn-helix domain-containing protein [Motilimonas cestriensis]MCE2593947.1 MarR family winged helix-turn-helix transcriptional regulator [Motilimonas cestriensis]
MTERIISHLIQQQHQLIDAKMSQLARARGCEMTPAQQTIFRLASQQIVTLSELAQHLAISRQAVQKTVAVLVDKKWLKLVPNPGNRAAKIVIITEQGQIVRQQQQQVVREVELHLYQQLGEEKAKLLQQLLNEEWQLDNVG